VDRNPSPAHLQRAQFTLVPWLGKLNQCYEQARNGKISAKLWIDCLVPPRRSVARASRSSRHDLLSSSTLPYRLGAFELDVERDRLHDQIIRSAAEFVPAVKAIAGCEPSVYATRLESVFGITEGKHLSR